ncbi:excinuclease ABC subunit C [Candidatus Izimaplasma bacterium ZiA1]|uniref:excinuclease ABC subunit UvrC n=1 Tax=Candidatus Izimoplasma sp. ZiA1 TaxID=2024899 RepID=UPI000BAA3B87|nr:excinuclease ABC subunit C [Candidatus Izimaplasma bacterium ZiA1]
MLKEKIKLIPELPGSYQYFDKYGKIIYVGKAKNLKKRVSSYFSGAKDAKTSKLVMNIHDIEYIVTSSELDALILELNLIKKYNPRYNIMLTDDKTYPYIEITNELHPKLIVSRKVKKTSKNIFGPYPNVGAARSTAKLLDKIYPLRKCIKLPKQECLYYHLGQCLAPCINKVTKEDYENIIQDIKAFLKGDIKKVVTELNKKMNVASENLEFEKANEYKKTIEDIKTTTNRQKINLNDLKDRDIVGVYNEDNYLSIEIFFIRNGKISARHQQLFEIYTNPEKSLIDFLGQFYTKEIPPKEIFINDYNVIELEELLNTKFITPKIGDKKKLLDLAVLNAKQGLFEKIEMFKRKEEKTIGAIVKLGEILNIKTPYRIEAFDNSNLFGEHAVSSMVVFINGKKAPKEYRKYKIKTLNDKASDFDTMKEVLYRRYLKLIMDKSDFPDLIVVDGGKPQITAAKEVLNSLDISIPLVGLVKDDTHSTNSLMNDNYETYSILKTSNEFRLLSLIQEEAHRFAINYHRNIRDKGVFYSVLDDVEYIGEVTKSKLLQEFKTISNIKQASENELKALGLNKKQIKSLFDTLKK